MTTSKEKVLEKVSLIKKEFHAIEERLAKIDIQKDYESYQALNKERAALEPIIQVFDEHQRFAKEYEDTTHVLREEKDEEMRTMFREELNQLEKKLENSIMEMMRLLIPKDPNDEKNIMLEIRAGAGGDEAGLFVGNLYRMYEHFASEQKWKIELLSSSPQGVGGYREIIAMVKGNNVYSKLKFEAGVHRVQRVPETETQGRVHTSTVTVAVLPEADEVEIAINPNELRIDVYRSSGPGGQSVNTTDSAVRITHIPTGITVAMQDEKSQHKNKSKAMKILRNKLYSKAMSEQQATIASSRKLQVGTGERSERIRTYNFPQSRVTDHRVGLTLYELDAVMVGKLDRLIEPLIADYQSQQITEHLEALEGKGDQS